MPNVELPEEVAALVLEHEETAPDRLAALAIAIVSKRQDAIAARKSSGIEEVWLKAEEAYLGIDDTNRASFAGACWAKPTTMTGPITTGAAPTEGEITSAAYVRLTSRYVDAGAAKLGEILLPADEKAFSFTNLPVPELIKALKDASPAVHDGIPLMRDAPAQTPGVALPGQPGAVPPAVPITVKDIAEEALDIAETAAKKAEKRIYSWMVKSRYRGETRKVIFDAARIGVGVLKAPFPRKEVSRTLNKDTKGVEMVGAISPACEWRSPWNIYPDGACGENIQNGDHLFDVDFYSEKQLKKLKGTPGYISAAIDKVVKDGPASQASDTQKPGEEIDKNRYAVWYFYGTLKREDMVAAGAVAADEKGPDEVYAIVTMVNDTIIRASINPLDSGEFPYHSVPWQRRAGHWAGVGVGEQIEMPQRAINAAIRALFNNAGKSAGSMIVVDRGSIAPADKSWVLTPDKLFFKSSDATTDDVRKAFAFFQVPNMGPQLMAIIELCLRLAEESTNIPLVTQGQSGPTSPDTFGATQLQNNNANQLLRNIGYAFDDYITEPVVIQYYEYLLLDPDVPEDEKGEWHIDAHGSVALIERAIQDQTIQQMGQFAINPAFGVDPKLWFAEFSKTKHLNPKNFQYTAEKQAQIDAQPKPQAPAVEVAQIKSADAKAALAADAALAAQDSALRKELQKAIDDTKLALGQWRKEADELRIKRDTDRDTVYVQAETARNQLESEARMRELEVKRELAILEYANKKDVKLMDVKKELADTSMRLQVQKELSVLGHRVDLRKHDTPDIKDLRTAPAVAPAAEPAGVAPPGESFTK